MTQSERILGVLKARAGQWVSMPELADAAGCYAVHSRISQLREEGWQIPPAKIEGTRPRRSFYRLILDPQQELAL